MVRCFRLKNSAWAEQPLVVDLIRLNSLVMTGSVGRSNCKWNQPVPVTWVSDYTVYGFYDIGLVWNDDATTNDGRAESLASVGLGIRTTIMPGTDAGFMVCRTADP